MTKAVPLFFVAEAELFRNRFYWRDQRIGHAVRRWRIVFQPLTSTYRVTFDGGLSQNYATRAEAFAAISYSARWKIAEPGPGGRRKPALRRIQLPARHVPIAPAMQIGIGGQADWRCRSSALRRSISIGPKHVANRSHSMTKAQRWAWLISTVAATGAGLVLAFLLSIATNNPALYERHFVWLFWSTSPSLRCWRW